MHFGEYRFSEDLDFTLTKEVSLEDLFKAFKEVFEVLVRVSGIRNYGRGVMEDSPNLLSYLGPVHVLVKIEIQYEDIGMKARACELKGFRSACSAAHHVALCAQ